MHPAVEVQSLNHWTAREVPFVAYFIPNSFCLLLPCPYFSTPIFPPPYWYPLICSLISESEKPDFLKCEMKTDVIENMKTNLFHKQTLCLPFKSMFMVYLFQPMLCKGLEMCFSKCGSPEHMVYTQTVG